MENEFQFGRSTRKHSTSIRKKRTTQLTCRGKIRKIELVKVQQLYKEQVELILFKTERDEEKVRDAMQEIDRNKKHHNNHQDGVTYDGVFFTN